MRSRYYSDSESESDKSGLAAGAGATAGGGILLAKLLKRKKSPKRSHKKGGSGTNAMKLTGERTVSGGGQGFWSGGVSGARRYGKFKPIRFLRTFHSEIEDKTMEIKRKLFSTGDPELDDILEEVYYSGISDGYDYAYQEKLYAESEDESAADVAAAGGLAAAGTYGIGKLRSNRAIKKGTAEATERASKYFKNAEEEAFKNSRGGSLTRKVQKKLNAAAKEAENISRAGRAEAEARAKSIGKKSKIGAAAVLTASGLLATGKALKNRNRKSE